MDNTTMCICLWNDTDIEEELEATVEDIFIMPDTVPLDTTDHVQMRATLADGRFLEIRLPVEWLKPEILAQMYNL